MWIIIDDEQISDIDNEFEVKEKFPAHEVIDEDGCRYDDDVINEVVKKEPNVSIPVGGMHRLLRKKEHYNE